MTDALRFMAAAALLITPVSRPPTAHPSTERAARDSLPLVHPNDNRTPAGRVHRDTLELKLEVRMATWRPEADSGPAIEVAAFAEVGHAPEIPAPLIRVPTGTIIVASVRNLLTDSTIAVHGLRDPPGGSGRQPDATAGGVDHRHLQLLVSRGPTCITRCPASIPL